MGKLRTIVAAAGLLPFMLVVYAGCDEQCPEDDGNACTADACQSGATVHTALPDGSICHDHGRTGVCHEAVCVVPCGTVEECDDDNPCTTDACVQPDKFCVHVADDALVPPDDGNPCTWGGCSGGKEHHFPVVSTTPCGQGECVAGICDTCETPEDCGKDTACRRWTCENGACVEDYTAAGTFIDTSDVKGDCRQPRCDGYGSIVEILWETDEPPDDGNACTHEVCKGWTPYHEPWNQGFICEAGFCDGAGVCVECTINAHCGTLHCFKNKCFACDNLIQDGDEEGVDCGGSCEEKCLGVPCSQDAECKGGSCEDGVCCNGPCGTCRLCNVAGSEGLCMLVAKYGEDPPSCSITGGKMCNGGGTCQTALGAPASSANVRGAMMASKTAMSRM